jgi:hypothetical protein
VRLPSTPRASASSPAPVWLDGSRIPGRLDAEGILRPNLTPPLQLAEDGGIVHTPSMTLKNAALLALIGTILIAVILAFDLIRNVLNVVQGLVPAVTLFTSLIYAFGAFCVAVFFFVFHKAQS